MATRSSTKVSKRLIAVSVVNSAIFSTAATTAIPDAAPTAAPAYSAAMVPAPTPMAAKTTVFSTRSVDLARLIHARCQAENCPDLETINPQQPSDGALDLRLRGDELHPGRECRSHRLRRGRFDVHRPVVAETHHLGDAAGVVLVGLDRTRRQEALRLARLDTDDRYTRLTKPPMEPLRQRTRLDPGKLDWPRTTPPAA